MKIMKVTQVCLTILASFTSLLLLSTRARAAGEDYKITKISPAVIITPDYNYIGDQRRIPGPFAQWLEIEVQFESYVDFTDELTFRYYLLFAGNLLSGEVTHISILRGRDLHSVMYVAPHSIIKLLEGKQLTPAAIQNVGVQILNKGQLIDEVSWKPAQAESHPYLQTSPARRSLPEPAPTVTPLRDCGLPQALLRSCHDCPRRESLRRAQA